jgi:hypothetical protein
VRPSSEQTAIAAVTATADLLAAGGWPDCDTEAHRLLHDTDLPMVALLAGILVCRLGEPARDALREMAIAAAHNAEEPA